MLASLKLSPKVVVLGLVACLLLPAAARANPPSTFQDPLCGGPNCVCFGPNFCILQLRINNPKHVHFKPLGDWEFINVLGPGIKQFEARPGQTVYVNRGANGPTSFSVQFCKRSLTGSTCSPWTNMTLQEPTVGQLEECENYAARAVQAAKDNVKFNCGYVGGRWGDDYKAHYNACAFAPGSQPILVEDKARKDDLATCKNKTTAKVEPPKAADYNGSWIVTTDKGGAFRFLLNQQGNAVTGQMINDSDAKFSGTLDGNLRANGEVHFRFNQPGINTTGSGAVWFHPNVNSLIGWVRTDTGTGAALEGKRQ